jgi:hypothetical protein
MRVGVVKTVKRFGVKQIIKLCHLGETGTESVEEHYQLKFRREPNLGRCALLFLFFS